MQHVDPVKQNLVLIFYLVCKLYLGHLTTIIDVILLIHQRI